MSSKFFITQAPGEISSCMIVRPLIKIILPAKFNSILADFPLGKFSPFVRSKMGGIITNIRLG